MPSSFLEIVELPNGDIVLLRADGDGEPLVNIRFSDESRDYMPESRLEIARAMIQAGIETAVMLSEERDGEPLEASYTDTSSANEDDEETPRVLH